MEWTPSTNGPNEAFTQTVTVHAGGEISVGIPQGHEATVCLTPVDGATAKLSAGIVPNRAALLVETDQAKLFTVEPCSFVVVEATGGGDDGAVIADFLVWRAKR